MTFDYSTLLKKNTDKNIKHILENPFTNKPNLKEAVNISKKYNLPLHPSHTLYWDNLTTNQFISLLKNLLKHKEEFSKEVVQIEHTVKELIEILGLEHTFQKNPIENVHSEKEAFIIILNKEEKEQLLTNLGIEDIKDFEKHIEKLIEYAKENITQNSCQIISENSKIKIREKGGSYIGARMGRPEKAKMRKLDGKPHGLFPIGHGRKIKREKDFRTQEAREEIIQNRLRNIIESINDGAIKSEFCIYECIECRKESVHSICIYCNSKTKKVYFEKYTDNKLKNETETSVRYKSFELDLEPYVKEVRRILGNTELPKLVKGIKGTSNKHKVAEHISKAFLREKNNVYVNKDGTVRFDMIEMGLTHFRPSEIGTSIEKLKELGYKQDYEGNELKDENQLLEIFPQDVILPDCTESGDELASDFVINTGKFVDELLQKLYNQEPFYNFKTKEDTIGHLLIGLAPHTSAGIVGRILGYSKTQGCFSHPVWHAAQRRNLDGDENGVMLLLDGLINFSRDFLPDRRGSRSVTEDTIIFIEENDQIKTVKIGEYIDKIFENGYSIEDDGFETKVPKNLKTFSFQNNGNVTLEKVTKLIRHKNDKKIYEIKSSDGWITTTQDHSIFILNYKTGKIEEKSVEELKKGDFIVTLGKLNIKKNNLEKIYTEKLGIKKDIRGNQVPTEIYLNEHFFRILGFIYAEGYIKNNKCEIGNTDIKVIRLISNDIKSILDYEPSICEDKRDYKDTNGKYYRINLPTKFVKVLLKLGVNEERAGTKQIPDFVYRASKDNIEAFIQGYMIGDGTSYMGDNQRKMIRLYTSSKGLASGLSLLAYLCGKKSTCRKSSDKKEGEKYEVCISKYKERSSFWSVYHLRKEINEGLNNSKIGKKEKNALLSNIVQNTKLKSSSKHKIKKIIKALEKSDKNEDITKKIKNILNQCIRIEIVNEIKEISYSGYVYDLEVPKFQNFLCGPHPIFAHNTMDTSLVLTSHLYLDQIDDEVHGMDIVPYYPLEFYQAAKKYESPKSIKIEKVEKRIDEKETDKKYLGYKFTHNTTNMNNTILCSAYKSVPSMSEKLDLQLKIGKKIRAVDEDEVGTLVIDKHFMKDIKGNLRKFGMQSFRCTNCNTIYRRPPLNGKCNECHSPSINFTIHEGSIKKYLTPSFNIVKNYNVDPYIVESLELANLRIEGVFGKEQEQQKSLNDFFGK